MEKHYKKQEEPETTPIGAPPKTRRCLMCGDSFQSEWAGERVCKKCKSTSTWRTG